MNENVVILRIFVCLFVIINYRYIYYDCPYLVQSKQTDLIINKKKFTYEILYTMFM